MNLGKSVKHLSAKFNLAVRNHHGQIKMKFEPNSFFNSTDLSLKFKNAGSLKNLLCDSAVNKKFMSVSKDYSNGDIVKALMGKTFLYDTQERKFSIIEPKENFSIRKIIDPKITINVETPTSMIINQNLELPCIAEKEIKEPLKNILPKRAVVMIRIRRRKMRKHKWKKFHKKMKFEFAKVRQKREMEKEIVFQNELKEILKVGGQFSAKDYVKETLWKVNWTPPVTRVKGILAPQDVIKKYLEDKEKQKLMMERINECIKSLK